MGFIYTKKVEFDGYKFDSEMEFEYYKLLKERLIKDEIKDLQVHPQFELQKDFYNCNGKYHKAIIYEPDFVFYDNTIDKTRYIDVKGMMTDDFILKWKLFDYYLCSTLFGSLEILKYSKATGWVDYENYKKAMKTHKQQLVAKKNEALKKAKELEKERISEQKDLEKYFMLKRKKHLTGVEQKRLDALYEKRKDIIDKITGKEI